MSIKYIYKIIRVDEEARCMEVVYTAEGHQTMHIGARLPFVGETLESVVGMFSPVAHWEQQAMPVMLPEVGATGTIAPAQAAVQEQVITKQNALTVTTVTE